MTISMGIRASSLAVTMLAGWFAFPPAATAVNAVKSAQVAKSLSDAKVLAYQLREDADEMESYTHSNTTWQSHADAINRIKEDVNAMGRLITKLQADRDGAEHWQQTAIDRVIPLAKEMASNTTAAIDHLNKYPQRVNTAAYQNYLEAIADSADNLAVTITNFVDYGKAKQHLERMTTKLELPASSR